MSGYLQVGKSRYKDDLETDGQEFIEITVGDGERLRETVHGLIAYSRVEMSSSHENVSAVQSRT